MEILNMSDLQISLIIIGVIIIAGVAVFNWLQQLRYRRKVQAAFDHKHDDILLDSHNSEESFQRIEPKFNKMPPDIPFDPFIQTELPPIESKKSPARPTANATANISASAVTNSSATSPILDYDSNTNYVVNIRSESVIANTYIAKLLQRKFDFGKPVYWLGQRDKNDSWEEITNESNVDSDGYSYMKGCLQLADRAGPISEVNISKFRDLVLDFASQVHATAECPDIVSTHEKAVMLDKFCAEVDVMIGINQNEEEKEAGVVRIEMVEQRNGPMDGKCLFWLSMANQRVTEFTKKEIDGYREAINNAKQQERANSNGDL